MTDPVGYRWQQQLFVRSVQKIVFCATITACYIAFHNKGLAQSSQAFLEDFETATICLEMNRPDAHQFKVLDHSRTTSEKHSGNSSEYLRYWLSSGSHFYYQYPIEHAHLIREFSPSIWVKADKPGIQLIARVVLPQTKDPTATDKAMTCLLRGPTYDQTNRWQKLDFDDLKQDATELLAEQAVILGRKYEMAIDTRGAYVDSLFLNMFTATGQTRAWIDELKIDGAIATSSNSTTPNRRSSTANNSLHPIQLVSAQEDLLEQSTVTISGSMLLIDGRPFSPRMIKHRGESFAYLKKLGFNTIQMASTPKPEQLRKAAELDLWIVAPPPPVFDATSAQGVAKYNKVLAWIVGERLSTADLEISRQKSTRIRRTDPLNRPVVCSAISDLSRFATICDVLIVELQPIGTTFDVNLVSTWLARRKKLAGTEIPIWAAVQTEYPELLERQIAAFDGSCPFLPIDYLQLRHLIWEIIPESDGLCFQSRRSLESADPESQFRGKCLDWINAQLKQIEPWLAGGRVSERFNTSDPAVAGHRIKTERSRLILLNHKWKSFNDGRLRVVKSVTFREPDASASDRVFRITERGFEPVFQNRTPAGLSIRLDHFQETASVVITSDPLTMKYLNASTQKNAAHIFQKHLDLTTAHLALVNHSLKELSQLGQPINNSLAAVENVVANLAQAKQMIRDNHFSGAEASLERADRFLRTVWRPRQIAIARQFTSRTASPLIQHFHSLPAHFRLMKKMRSGKWGENLLVGGDFELLRRMKESGWQQIRNPQRNVQSDILLADSSPVAGQAALHLRAWTDKPLPVNTEHLLDSSPVWVVSAPVHLRAGQIVRAHGWVKVSHAVTGSLDGFMIMDSIGGVAMANRYRAKSEWQEFTFYRAATDDKPFVMTFALTGLGEILLDEVSLRVFEFDKLEKPAMPNN